MAAKLLLENLKFNRLTAIKPGPHITTGKKPQTTWVCQCDCGNITTVQTAHLAHNHTKSCGCRSVETRLQAVHGLSKHPIYKIHKSIRDRCYLPTQKAYRYYGGRGIKMCNVWLNNPKAFIEWALINGYQSGLQIDRINNDGNYEPGNCRWVTPQENMRNTSRNKWVQYNGKQYTVTDYLNITGINRSTYYRNLKMGG